MKKFVFRLAALLLVLLIAAVVIGFLSLNSLVKNGVETIGTQLAKVEVRLGKARLSPFSGSGRLAGLLVGNPAGYKTPAAIKVGEIQVAIKASSILSDTIIVEDVNLQRPEITLEGGLNGNNLSKILGNLEASSAESGDAGKTGRSDRRFLVRELLIQGGKINLGLTPLGGKTMTVPLPDIHLQNIGTAGSGVSAAELARQIMKPLLTSVVKAAGEAAAGVGSGAKELGNGVKEIGKGAADRIEKTAKGIKDLLKRK